MAYHFTPAHKQGRFFYDFLGPRLRTRGLTSDRIRERTFQPPEHREQPRLVICADDFGFSQAISQSIVTLAQRGKLNAISCMSVCPGWENDAPLLRTLPASIQIGLHLTLTDEAPLTGMPQLAWDGRMPSCNELGRRALMRRLPLGELREEIAAQFDRFVDVFGRAPDFVDGHQHVHVLRGIREIILAETARRAPGAWIRNCSDRPAAMLARHFPLKAVANAAQSRGLREAAAAFGLRCNDSFAGLYDFTTDYAALFPSFLDQPGAFHLVICHPGGGNRPADGIAQARRLEAAALRRMPIHEMAAARGFSFEAVAPM
ncbi:MAG: ChbG/HpnK family deacetylase [Sphingobium sp.]|nr:ChbG/HpnK family deacetylase [Sphingobium sp.]